MSDPGELLLAERTSGPPGWVGSPLNSHEIINAEKKKDGYLLTTTIASPADVNKAMAVNSKPISLNFKDILLHLLINSLVGSLNCF